MRLFTHRRLIAGGALLAFLMAIAFPALAVVRQAVDPAAFATICRVDTGAASDPAAPRAPQGPLESAHCLLCLGTASPPPVASIVPVLVAAVPELRLPADRRPYATHDSAVLQPLNPRAPPRG